MFDKKINLAVFRLDPSSMLTFVHSVGHNVIKYAATSEPTTDIEEQPCKTHNHRLLPLRPLVAMKLLNLCPLVNTSPWSLYMRPLGATKLVNTTSP